MGIAPSEALLIVSGGCLFFSSFALIHFASTYNPHNRSLAFFSTILIGAVSFYAASTSTNHSKSESMELAMTSAFLGLLGLLPVFLAAITLVLFRISLLTNWSVDASS
ncbi:MAG: hypothetical protein CMB33_01550 [Euryarchaeota archaeon]|nr:hypothetical protein [Euryarchaeota archaeon]